MVPRFLPAKVPALARSFPAACEDLSPVRRFIVYPGEEKYPLGNGIQAIPLPDLARLVAGAA